MPHPDPALKNDFHIGNRAPLTPSPFMKLKIGAIQPRGWLRQQLLLQAEGFSGHLTEISGFLDKRDNAWLSPGGKGRNGWEEVPYWLKGFGDTGYVLGDERIIREARQWIEAALASPREDGFFGPRPEDAKSTVGSTSGKYDLWPNMVMLFALQSYHEFTGDPRVLELMKRYFRWELTVPEKDFLPPYWQHVRAADNLASVYWLYNRTGEPWLLELGEKIHRHTANWDKGICDWHNVNIAQAFDSPTIFSQQSHDPQHLLGAERNFREVRDLYGQVPGGMYGSDENCRPGYVDPRQAIETCGAVEQMLSDEQLLLITGDPVWAERCEDVAFNTFPATMTVDLKALRYLTAPNMVLSDQRNKAPGLQNGGPMLHMNPHSHRCCQHNVAHGWPYYAEHCWLATPGNGLAAVLYVASQVTAKVGDGTEVTVAEETRYPFDDTIQLRLTAPQPVKFPLYLRVPQWCDKPELQINGQAAAVAGGPPGYLKIERDWKSGDTVRLRLPMAVRLRVWEKNQNSVSVDRGPLTYSLKIGEKYVRAGGTDEWPAWEIHPTTPWNYGLVLKADDPAAGFEVVPGEWPANDRPFEATVVPLQLRTKAKRIPGWKLDATGLVGKLQPSPARSDEPEETVTLIPMGAARLRVSAFPTIGAGPAAHEWVGPKEPRPAEASHLFEHDTLAALSDNLLPQNSNDHSIPRFTWWDHRGSEEWVQYNFEKPARVTGVAVYWFDDTGAGQCRVPKSWRLVARDGNDWKPVAAGGEYGVAKDKWNELRFAPLSTTGLRIEAQLQEGFSAGILEWRLIEPVTAVGPVRRSRLARAAGPGTKRCRVCQPAHCPNAVEDCRRGIRRFGYCGGTPKSRLRLRCFRHFPRRNMLGRVAPCPRSPADAQRRLSPSSQICKAGPRGVETQADVVQDVRQVAPAFPVLVPGQRHDQVAPAFALLVVRPALMKSTFGISTADLAPTGTCDRLGPLPGGHVLVDGLDPEDQVTSCRPIQRPGLGCRHRAGSATMPL